MTHYRRLTPPEHELLPTEAEEWIEIGAEGVVTRELGFNADGDVVHQFPSDYFPRGDYGNFDLALFEMSGMVDDVDLAEFERKWQQALQETQGRPRPPDAFDRLVARIIRAIRRR
jgi:hypothetical protein